MWHILFIIFRTSSFHCLDAISQMRKLRHSLKLLAKVIHISDWLKFWSKQLGFSDVIHKHHMKLLPHHKGTCWMEPMPWVASWPSKILARSVEWSHKRTGHVGSTSVPPLTPFVSSFRLSRGDVALRGHFCGGSCFRWSMLCLRLVAPSLPWRSCLIQHFID